jgi:hypothetical protein
MNNKTVTSTVALLLSVACIGAQPARAQDATGTSSEVSQPPADGLPADDASVSGSTEAAAPAESTESSAPPADENPYGDASASADTSGVSEDTSAPEEEPAPPPERAGKLRWGAQLGYMFHTDPRGTFRSAKWMPIGLELDYGLGKLPFAVVGKVDVSPLCFGGRDYDCSGMQFRGFVGLEVGIQKAPGSVLHMVYLNASLGYRYASAEVADSMGSTTNGKVDGASQLISEISASMMIPVTSRFSIGPRVALSSNLTAVGDEGVSGLQLGLRVLHAP